MFFATKKGIAIIVIQLLFVIVKEAHSSPLPDVNIITNAWSSVMNVFHKTTNGIYRYFWPEYTPRKENEEKVSETPKEKPKLTCFGIARFFTKSFNVFLTDKTTDKSVKFYFVSQRKRDYATVSVADGTLSLNNTDFDPARDTVVISHGFMSHGLQDWVKDMSNAFLEYGDVNVIIVDWKEGSNTYNYISAAVTTQVVGDVVAQLFDLMYNDVISRGFDPDLLGKLHFVGHSLGAHIVARAANKIKEDQESNGRKAWWVNRITGLDPAQPCFIRAENQQRLDESDAEFVDVIHTNARAWQLLGLGLPARIGNLDFYPNGGEMQPGCPVYDDSIWSYIFVAPKLVNATVCSHGRAYLYFTDSILESLHGNCTYISHPWDRRYDKSTVDGLMTKSCTDNDCPEMGINSIQSFPQKKGIYFTPTSNKPPYCQIKENDKKLIADQLKHDASLSRMVNLIGK